MFSFVVKVKLDDIDLPVLVASQVHGDWNADYVARYKDRNLFFFQGSPLAFVFRNVCLEISIYQSVVLFYSEES